MPSESGLVKAWSFSRYNDYKKCPAFFKYKHIDKMAEAKNAAMERGTLYHKVAEDYLKGTTKILPLELKKLGTEYKGWKAQKIKVVEEQWAFTRDWSETSWTNWSNCWLRVKLDFAYINIEHNVLVPVDHKTGKLRKEKNDEYMEQLELYGMAGLIKYPDVNAVSPRLAYIDEGVVYPDPDEQEIEYTRSDESKLKKKWEKKVVPMFADKTFRPTPSDNACKFCTYKKENSGPCRY
jgi:PD-(D/E)XK nuclease superfamily